MRILNICSRLNIDSYARAEAQRSLGHDVDTVEMYPLDRTARRMDWDQRVIRKISKIIGRGEPDQGKVVSRIEASLSERPYEVLWIERGWPIASEYLDRMRSQYPDLRIIGYCADDILHPEHVSHNLLQGLKYYHHYFTTKEHNLEEIKKYGCASVHLAGNAYDPSTYHPISLNSECLSRWRSDGSFLGAYEAPRQRSMLALADSFPRYSLRIAGPNWPPSKNIMYSHEYLNYPDTVYFINASSINLCYLRRSSRDRVTTRSVEIPACAGFMLAERTDAHLELFTEDREAVYFSSQEELQDKFAYYLHHEDLRDSIRRAGYERCLRSGYTHMDRMRVMMEAITGA